MLNIKNWMDEMRLKMNPSKTEFIYFRFAQTTDQMQHTQAECGW